MFALATKEAVKHFFGTARRFKQSSKQSVVVKVDGKLNVSTSRKIYYTDVEVELFINSGRSIGKAKASGKANSDKLNDENAIYESYLQSLDSAILSVLNQKVPRRDNVTLADRLSKLKPPGPFKPLKKHLEAGLIEIAGTGTGFFVNDNGYIVTNYHVVKECINVSIKIGEKTHVTQPVAHDEKHDIAVLKVAARPEQHVTFDKSKIVSLGDEIVTMGYPLSGILSSHPSLTDGVISSLAGPEDNRNFLQISAPVQPGSGGGPLFDIRGNVIGVVCGSLSDTLLVWLTGSVPQNVNFAVNADVVRAFLNRQGIQYETGGRGEGSSADWADEDPDEIAFDEPAETESPRARIAEDYSKAVVQLACRR